MPGVGGRGVEPRASASGHRAVADLCLRYRLGIGFRALYGINERGKGDHRHVEGREEPYGFTDEKRFVQDFLADRRRLGGK